jgi:hypothetical protein
MVTNLQLNFNFGIHGVEGSECGTDVATAETQRSVNPNQAFRGGAGAADQLLDLIDLRLNTRDMRIIELSFGS